MAIIDKIMAIIMKIMAIIFSNAYVMVVLFVFNTCAIRI